jgi:hypothetical protein
MVGEGHERLHQEGSVFRHILPEFDAGDAPVLPASGLLLLGKIHADLKNHLRFPRLPLTNNE